MTEGLTLTLIGDTFVQRPAADDQVFGGSLALYPDADAIFAPNRAQFENSDVVFCNLETVVAEAEYVPAVGVFRGPGTDPSTFEAYMRAGINVVNLANNPSTYHGLAALERSFDVLDSFGVTRVGAGRDLAEARRPAVIERNGTKIAFVGRTSVGLREGAATPTRAGMAYFRIATVFEPHSRLDQAPGTPAITRTIPNKEDCAALAEDLALARDLADIVVLYWHWGLSLSSDAHGELVDYQMEMGRFAIDHGADIVAGGHCHELQPIEVYNGKVIAYGLGNYMHDMMPMFWGRSSSMLLRCRIENKEIAEMEYVPGWSGPGSAPAIYRPPSQVPELVEHVERGSAEFGTKFEIGTDAVRIVR